MYGYIYIFNYPNVEILEIECDEKDEPLTPEESIERRGINVNDINYMCSDDKLYINKLKTDGKSI